MYGYQGYGYPQNYPNQNYMQRAYSQPQQMAQQVPPMEMPIQDIKFVNKTQAEAYIVYPNTRVVLIDKENGVAYIKTADSMGQSQTDYFKFEPINADGTPIKPNPPAPQVNFDDFIKKEQLNDLGFATLAQYNDLAQKIDALQKQIIGGRQNVGQPKQ